MTPPMVAEPLLDDLALALDPVRLSRRIGIEPDPWQAKYLRSTARQQILLCSRQSGKSTTTAIRAIHRAVYQPGSPILCLSPTQRQSGELFRKIRSGLVALGRAAPRLIEESATHLSLANDSRVLCLPGSEATVRGYSGVKLLLVDEASRVEDALYHAVRPMLAVSQGEIVLLSTPFGKRGFFYDVWTEGGEDWERLKMTAYDCPRIPEAWLEREREQIGDWWFQQEYLCEFIDTEDQFFSTEDVMAALSDDVLPLFGDEA
jgi:hypothetical protein